MTKAQEVGRRIAQARRQKAVADAQDVRPADVARALDVSQATVSDWESGKTSPRDKLMERLAAFLGVTPAYLRYGVGAESAGKSASLVTHDAEAVRQRQAAKRDGGKRAAAGDRRGRGRPPKPR